MDPFPFHESWVCCFLAESRVCPEQSEKFQSYAKIINQIFIIINMFNLLSMTRWKLTKLQSSKTGLLRWHRYSDPLPFLLISERFVHLDWSLPVVRSADLTWFGPTHLPVCGPPADDAYQHKNQPRRQENWFQRSGTAWRHRPGWGYIYFDLFKSNGFFFSSGLITGSL